MNLETTRFADGPRLLADVGGTNARLASETSPRGRLQPYLEKIPTFLITEQYPAFLGVSAILSEH